MMTGQRCFVCGTKQSEDSSASFHRIPKDPERRTLWLKTFGLEEDVIKPSTRICSKHFQGGNAKGIPSLSVGKKLLLHYFSWYYIHTDYIFHAGRRFGSPIKAGERANRAQERETRKFIREHTLTPSTGPVTPTSTTFADDDITENSPNVDTPTEPTASLLARIELLESEITQLKQQPKKTSKRYFRIEDIESDDKLVRFYTGFVSYSVFVRFF